MINNGAIVQMSFCWIDSGLFSHSDLIFGFNLICVFFDKVIYCL